MSQVRSKMDLCYEIATELMQRDCLDVGNFGTDIDCLNGVALIIYEHLKVLTVLETDYLIDFIKDNIME